MSDQQINTVCVLAVLVPLSIALLAFVALAWAHALSAIRKLKRGGDL